MKFRLYEVVVEARISRKRDVADEISPTVVV